MNTILTLLAIAIISGTIDIIPMIIQKLDRRDTVSAFFHYFALGLIIPFINTGFPHWITGIIISLLTAIPIMIIVYPKDKKAIIPMTLFSIILGAGIAIAGAKFIG